MASQEISEIQVNPINLMETAVKGGASIEVLERLMALQERWQAQKSKEAFFQALVAFQNKVPGVKKTKEALFDGKLQYKYADLSDVINTIKDSAFEAGIAYQFKIDDKPDLITVTCLITAHGHTEATQMSSVPDGSGKKNAIQSRGSAIEYMKRYTLAGALGLSISEDNDGGKLLSEGMSIDEVKEKVKAIMNQPDLTKFYNVLSKEMKTNPDVKKALKDQEKLIKEANKKNA